MNITITNKTRELTTSEMGYYYFIPHFLHLLLPTVILIIAVATGVLLIYTLKSIPEEHLSIKVLEVQGHISEILPNDYPIACLNSEFESNNLNSYSIRPELVGIRW